MKDFSVFIDTNIFLRACVQGHVRQADACQDVLRAMQNGRLAGVTSELVIAEFLWTAMKFYRLSKINVLSLVKALIALPNLQIHGEPNMLLAIELYKRHSVKFIDAVIASYELVQIGQLPILSYDKDFDTMHIKRYEPADIISS